jgi:hypothetical protein
MIIPVMTGTTGTVIKYLRKHFISRIGKTFNGFGEKTQLHLEHHTQYGKYCSLKLEASVVGIAVGAEVPGRKDL